MHISFKPEGGMSGIQMHMKLKTTHFISQTSSQVGGVVWERKSLLNLGE